MSGVGSADDQNLDELHDNRDGEQMLSVLISYMSDDFDAVAAMADNLKANGAEVWMDKYSMTPGQPWAAQFPRKLDACDAVVSFFSEHMFPRRERPFIAEQRLIDKRLRSIPRPIFIPVRLARIETTDLNYNGQPLEDLHCIDFFGDNLKMLQIQFDRLFLALNLEPSNVPRPFPGRLIVRCARRKDSFDGTVRGLDVCIDRAATEFLSFGTTRTFNLIPGNHTVQAIVDFQHVGGSGSQVDIGFEVFSKSKEMRFLLAPFGSITIEVSVQDWSTTNSLSEAFLFKWALRAAGVLPQYQNRDSWPEGVSIDVVA